MNCPKCGGQLRHRALSGLYWCPNKECPDYSGVPPIKVNFRAPNISMQANFKKVQFNAILITVHNVNFGFQARDNNNKQQTINNNKQTTTTNKPQQTINNNKQ